MFAAKSDSNSINFGFGFHVFFPLPCAVTHFSRKAHPHLPCVVRWHIGSWAMSQKPGLTTRTPDLWLGAVTCADVASETVGVAEILQFAFGEWGWTWRDRVARGEVCSRRNPPKRMYRLKRIHTSTFSIISTTILDAITLLFLHLVTPNQPSLPPALLPNDSNSAKCRAHALPYSPKCINNPPFLLVTNTTASTKPPSSQTLFLTNPLHSITYLRLSSPNTT